MKATKEPKNGKGDPTSGAHKKATYTLPPDVLHAVDENWRFHETLNAGLADSKSEYVADLIRRDTAKKQGTARRVPRLTLRDR
jgi:hypothetical protein